MIKQNLIFADNKEMITGHFTAAIKQHGYFAKLVTVRSPNLSLDRYINTDKKNKSLNFGILIPDFASLYYSVLVGPRGASFPRGHFGDVSAMFFDLNLFRIGFFWCFVPLFSDHTGAKLHKITLPPKKNGNDETSSPSFDTGMPAKECIKWFKVDVAGMREQHLCSVMNGNAQLQALAPMIRRLPTLDARRAGRLGEPDFRAGLLGEMG